MQFRELRRVLQSIVLAGLPMSCDIGVFDGAASDQPSCGTWTEPGATKFTLDLPAEPPMTLRIESCRVDVDACVELCRYALRASGLGLVTGCEVELFANEVKGAADYVITHSGPECSGVGRRPAGLVAARSASCDSAIGRWFAHAAWLEAASVPAFVYLARELDQFGAPRALVRAALASVRDEIRHAQIMSTLARRWGATPPPVELARPRERSLEAFAIENATEGCVSETWGAATALWQSRRAGDAVLRDVFRGIAIDEARHAGLAWEIDRWVATQLDASERARVVAARVAAARALLDADHRDDTAMLGLPAYAHARGLLARMNAALWRAS